MLRARLPDFPLSIEARIFTQAKEWLSKYNWSGPVSIGVDDTKLQPALRTYWDEAQQVHILIGATGQPRAITSMEDVHTIIQTAEKATKVRRS
jgi:hypothetical protein